MDDLNCRSRCLLLLLPLLLLLLLIPSPFVRGGGWPRGEEESPSPVERAIGDTTAALNSRWGAVRTWANLAWMKIRPPPSRFDRGASNGGEVVMDAATRSFRTGKETVEKSARSAAEVAEEAFEKAKEKVKRSVSKHGGATDAEL